MKINEENSAEGVDPERMHRALPVDHLDDGERAIVEIQGMEIAIFNINGTYYGLSNFCVHQGGPACEGLVSGTLTESEDGQLTYDREGQLISCPWHGWTFDITTGRHVGRPDRYRLPTYQVVIQDGYIHVVL